MRFINFMPVILLITIMFSCTDKKEEIYVASIKAWQDTLNTEFKDTSESPLTGEAFKNFNGLDFFKIDSKYRIAAIFKRTPGLPPFGMKTTTDRLPVYVKYGEAVFSIDGVNCKLNIYQNQELIKRPEYRDYLFIPFLDKTSGDESYEGGRYLDLHIPQGDTIIIDFNKAYNPYCAYNHHYSCPIPPYDNALNVEIRAGVKAWKK